MEILMSGNKTMCLLNKSSLKCFQDHKDVFLTGHKITLWDNTEDIEKYLELFTRIKVRLRENCSINIDLNYESDQELLRLLSEQRFPIYNPFSKYIYGSLSIENIDNTKIGFRKDIAYFIEHCIPKNIKTLLLNGGI
mmetsp:Transcript_10255/g.9057  ORF Transcript_10255/g.9057 Transcript_10255/m.9057 type:complete len:137 (-) Transcript_10255:428-838(-)